MRIRVIRKFALRLDGLDLSDLQVDDIIDLPDRFAKVLLAQGWAGPVAETVASELTRDAATLAPD
jgi:hypothetical protein